jgi:hypothetical protein
VNYYEITDDICLNGYSHLRVVNQYDKKVMDLSSVENYFLNENPPNFAIQGEINPKFDFCLGAFAVPIVSEKFADILHRFVPSEVRLIPVEATGKGKYYILHTVGEVKCLDEEKSVFTKWQPTDHRPDLVGSYRMIMELKIDSAFVCNRDFFRIQGWEIVLIVSDRIKSLIDRYGITGCSFTVVR